MEAPPREWSSDPAWLRQLLRIIWEALPEGSLEESLPGITVEEAEELVAEVEAVLADDDAWRDALAEAEAEELVDELLESADLDDEDDEEEDDDED